MITLIATPKAFSGHFGVIQTNAIKSWRSLGEGIEIILFDNNEGTKEIAEVVGAKFVPNIKKNEEGTPFLSEILKQGQQLATYKTCCYVNADIIFPPDFTRLIKRTADLINGNFLLVGSRYDLDWEKLIDYSDKKEYEEFLRYAKKSAIKHKPSGIDYFIFPKGFYRKIPDFLAGRAGFDNWLIWKARRKGAKVIDASVELFAIHQNHDYSHVKGGRSQVFEGEEALHNYKFLGKDKKKSFNILDTTWKFEDDNIVIKNDKESLNRRLGKLEYLYPEVAPLMRFYKKFHRKILQNK